MNTPSFPKENPPSIPPHPFKTMELELPAETVSLKETISEKNPVIRYGINTIYILLLWEKIENDLEQYGIIGSSINGKGGGGYHAG